MKKKRNEKTASPTIQPFFCTSGVKSGTEALSDNVEINVANTNKEKIFENRLVQCLTN